MLITGTVVISCCVFDLTEAYHARQEICIQRHIVGNFIHTIRTMRRKHVPPPGRRSWGAGGPGPQCSLWRGQTIKWAYSIFNTSEIAYGMCKTFLGCLCCSSSVFHVVLIVVACAGRDDCWHITVTTSGVCHVIRGGRQQQLYLLEVRQF